MKKILNIDLHHSEASVEVGMHTYYNRTYAFGFKQMVGFCKYKRIASRMRSAFAA